MERLLFPFTYWPIYCLSQDAFVNSQLSNINHNESVSFSCTTSCDYMRSTVWTAYDATIKDPSFCGGISSKKNQWNFNSQLVFTISLNRKYSSFPSGIFSFFLNWNTFLLFSNSSIFLFLIGFFPFFVEISYFCYFFIIFIEIRYLLPVMERNALLVQVDAMFQIEQRRQ